MTAPTPQAIQAATMSDQGLGLAQIAAHLGMSPSQAYLALRGTTRGRGTTGPRPRLQDDDVRARFARGETALEMAVATGFTVNTVRARIYALGLAQRPRAQRPRAQRLVRHDAEISARFSRGETVDEIAAATGLGGVAVRQRIYELGLAVPCGSGRSLAPVARPAAVKPAAVVALTDQQAHDVKVLMARAGYSRAAAVEAVLRPKVRIRLISSRQSHEVRA